MEHEKLIEKAKEMLGKADNGSNDCKQYNNGFIDGLMYNIKALRQPPVSGSLHKECVYYNLSDQAACPNTNVCQNCKINDR
ncbi:MAG: hypothetical protein RIR01_1370 [Bacteroidota bacterium]|jgi:hypothetical protein